VKVLGNSNPGLSRIVTPLQVPSCSFPTLLLYSTSRATVWYFIVYAMALPRAVIVDTGGCDVRIGKVTYCTTRSFQIQDSRLDGIRDNISVQGYSNVPSRPKSPPDSDSFSHRCCTAACLCWENKTQTPIRCKRSDDLHQKVHIRVVACIAPRWTYTHTNQQKR
jgi:hypothetical protein